VSPDSLRGPDLANVQYGEGILDRTLIIRITVTVTCKSDDPEMHSRVKRRINVARPLIRNLLYEVQDLSSEGLASHSAAGNWFWAAPRVLRKALCPTVEG